MAGSGKYPAAHLRQGAEARVVRRVAVLLLLAALTAAAACPARPPLGRQTPKPSDDQLLDIARRLFTDYLTAHEAETVPARSRLLDFRLDELRLVRAPVAPRPLVWVRFSVLPADKDSDWWAGNGTVGRSGWIVDKNLFLDIADDGAGYVIKGMGTSP